MKEVVKGRAPDTMDTLVQQTESPFTAEVLRYPLPAKFRMPQVEAFDGVKDPVDHLNTYKNQMELHGYQDPVRCRAFATTLKGHSAKSPSAHFDEPIYPAQATLPQESDQLRLHHHLALNASKATVPRATLLTLTSSSHQSTGRAPTIYIDEPFTTLQTDGLLPTIHIDEAHPSTQMDELLLLTSPSLHFKHTGSFLLFTLTSPPLHIK